VPPWLRWPLQAQALGHPKAEEAWLVLQKLAQAEDVRGLFGIRPRTAADEARMIAECEMKLAMQRTKGGALG
jgi:hypothetical protein